MELLLTEWAAKTEAARQPPGLRFRKAIAPSGDSPVRSAASSTNVSAGASTALDSALSWARTHEHGALAAKNNKHRYCKQAKRTDENLIGLVRADNPLVLRHVFVF